MGPCLRCAEIKQACDGGMPCGRCLRLSLPCFPKGQPKSQYGAAPVQQRPKARIRRVQTGCMTCKQRKKKCDEGKPRCGNCSRLCLGCVWPTGSAARGMRNGQRPRATSELGMTSTWLDDPVDPTDMSQYFGLSEELVLPAVTDGSGLTFNLDHDLPIHDDACWDFTPPSPLCMDMASHSPPPSASPSGSFASGSLSMYVPSVVPDLSSADDKVLLNHYSNIVASVLCRHSDAKSNPYLTYILPMALSSDLVMKCVLSLSAKHWHTLQPRLSNQGLYLQSQAIQSLGYLLSHIETASASVALASCLLLCMTELFDGASPRWKLHLTGAKRILVTMKSQFGHKPTEEYMFLIRLSRFLDSATTTTTCMAPLMDGEGKEEVAVLDRSTAAPDDEDMAVYGIPKALFHQVDRVNKLAEKRKTRVDLLSESAFLAEVMTVEERLDHWSYEHGGLSRAVSRLSPANDDTLHATKAFEWALRLRLHQISEGYALDHPKVSRSVEAILEAVQKIRYGSPLEGCLLFPLVMVGGACSHLEHRVIVQDRLMVMERTYGFGYIYRARELVERVWARRDQLDGSEAMVNWARIRFEEMGGLAVF